MKSLTKFVLIAALLSLSACAGNKPREVIVEVKVPVPVPCKINPIPKPSMPFQEASPLEEFGVKLSKLLAEVEIRKGYETELESAVKSCQ
jgi:hypothetical protein